MGRDSILRVRRPFYKIIPNLVATPELSYLLGVRYGDGRLMTYKRTSAFSLGLIVKDKDFVEAFKKCADKVVNKKHSFPPWQEKRGYWGYAVYSKMLYEYMVKPLEHQMEVISTYPANFIRGFFDSEGSVIYSRPQANRKNMDIQAYSSELWLLEKVSLLLEKFFRINPKIRSYMNSGFSRPTKWRMFRLCIRRCRDQKRFAKNIGFSIGRKQTKLLGGL